MSCLARGTEIGKLNQCQGTIKKILNDDQVQREIETRSEKNNEIETNINNMFANHATANELQSDDEILAYSSNL